MKDLPGRVAVVTGGASGIGRGLADRFAAEGMKVVLADIENSALADSERELRAAGHDVLAVRTDVSKPQDLEELAHRAVEAFGAVHVVCNNAGVGAGGLIWETSLDDWRWTLGVNLWGVIHGIRSFVPIMLAQGDECHVVNTASMAGLTSGPFMGPYNVSKHGVVTLSETLHQDLRAVGAKIGVSVLCPGFVNTRIAESGRNRPTELGAQNVGPAGGGDRREWMEKMLASGMAPSAVADRVLDAILNDRFYVLTHPEMKPAIEARMHDILEERTPAPRRLA